MYYFCFLLPVFVFNFLIHPQELEAANAKLASLVSSCICHKVSPRFRYDRFVFPFCLFGLSASRGSFRTTEKGKILATGGETSFHFFLIAI